MNETLTLIQRDRKGIHKEDYLLSVLPVKIRLKLENKCAWTKYCVLLLGWSSEEWE